MKNYVYKIDNLEIELSRIKNKIYQYQGQLKYDDKFINHLANRGVKINDNTKWLVGVVGDLDIPIFDEGMIRIRDRDYFVIDGYELVKVAYLDITEKYNKNFIILKNNF